MRLKKTDSNATEVFRSKNINANLSGQFNALLFVALGGLFFHLLYPHPGWIYVELLLAIIAAISFFSISPWTLTLDYHEQIFHMRVGFWPFSKTISGPFSDLYCVRISYFMNSRVYFLSILLKQKKKLFVVSAFNTEKDAAAFGHTLASKLKIDLLVRPKWKSGQWCDGQLFQHGALW